MLKSSEMLALMASLAEERAARAGDGFEAVAFIGRDRARSYVRTATFDGKVRQATEHVLEKVV